MSPGSRARWFVVVIFAIAMAWVEAAVVFDLRTLVDRIQPYQPDPLPLIGKLGPVELVREFATLVMLGTAGWLAGWSGPTRLGFSALAFGIWDVFYYVFLKVMCDWPRSLLDWDILFLLPLPWWGPVLAPVLIATLMIIWGTLAVFIEHNPPSPVSNKRIWSACLGGTLVALYVFMTDAIQATAKGPEAVRKVLPASFNWLLFIVALGLMSTPVIQEFMNWKRRQITRIAATRAT